MTVVYILYSNALGDGSSKSFLSIINGVMPLGVRPIVFMRKQFSCKLVLLKLFRKPYADQCQRRLHEMEEKLKDMGVETHMVRYASNIYPPTAGIKNIIMFVPRLIWWNVMNVTAYRKMEKMMCALDVDIIHTNNSVCDIGWKLARKLSVPHVWHIREYGNKDHNIHLFPNKSIFYRRSKSSGNHCICITKDIESYYHLAGSASSSVIYNGVYKKNDLVLDERKEPFLIYMGKIVPSKGLLDLLGAYKRYVEFCDINGIQPLELRVAGTTTQTGRPYYEKTLVYVKENNLQKRVLFLGNVDDVRSLLRKATALVLPSKSEGFGRCMAEAMFCGCLVIARNAAGQKEQFDNGRELMGQEIGLKFRTEDELLECLKLSTQKPFEYFKPMVMNASKTVNNLYSIENNAHSIYDLYRQLAKR